MGLAKGVCCIDENVGLSPLQGIMVWNIHPFYTEKEKKKKNAISHPQG